MKGFFLFNKPKDVNKEKACRNKPFTDETDHAPFYHCSSMRAICTANIIVLPVYSIITNRVRKYCWKTTPLQFFILFIYGE